MTGVRRNYWPPLTLAALLLWPAILNGLPLVFPDSGTYLGIAFGHDYAIDRSSIYGFLLKPWVTLLAGAGGLWLGIAAQSMAIACTLWIAARAVAGGAGAIAAIAAVALFTSLPWHAAQFMPDAFTGAIVLLAWLAASRDPAAPGALALWAAAILLALTHLTHPPLLLAAAIATIAAHRLTGLPWRDTARRAVAAIVATALAFGLLIAANGAVLGRWTASPLGPLFLFARLNEDGLIQPWLTTHCGRDAPADLCAERPAIPHDSQRLLWGDAASFAGRRIWNAPSDATRWRWIAMLSAANAGAIQDAPLRFIATSAAGAADQFVHFAALDDECPANCRSRASGIGFAITTYRPSLLPAYDRTMQLRGTLPKGPVRWITGTIAILALCLAPFALLLAWRRRDGVALSLLAAIAVTLVANAAMAGALSDVHDRYQSRLIWVLPFALLLLVARWRRMRPS